MSNLIVLISVLTLLVGATSCSSGTSKGDAQSNLISIPTYDEVKATQRITLEEMLSITRQQGVVFVNASEDENRYFSDTIVFHPDNLIDELGKVKFDAIVTYCSCPGDYSAAALAVSLRKRGYKQVFPLQGGAEALRLARAEGKL